MSRPTTDVWRRHGVMMMAVASLSGVFGVSGALADSGPSNGFKWAATWATAIQGTYQLPTTPQSATVPAYDPQPDLRFALPNATTEGANNQTFRMIVKPDLWGQVARIKLSNVFGTKPVTFAAASVALQEYQANIVPGTSVELRFNGQRSVTVQPGQDVTSDGVLLPFVGDVGLLLGKNLAVSFAVQGTSGPASYHADLFTTGYISPPQSGDQTKAKNDQAFPYTTTSSFFLSEVDVLAPRSTVVICAFGDSITDGTFSTLNGNDRWSNAMSRRLHSRFGNAISVVNEAIAGNAVSGIVAGPSAIQRYQRDVLGLAGLTTVIWLEGINDLGFLQSAPPPIIAGYQQVVAGLHQAHVKVIGATLTSSYPPNGVIPPNSPLVAIGAGSLYGSAQTNSYRQQVNAYIMTSGLFDGVADFATPTTDPSTGALYAQFAPNSEGSAGDDLHPNRAGYLVMGRVGADAVSAVLGF